MTEKRHTLEQKVKGKTARKEEKALQERINTDAFKQLEKIRKKKLTANTRKKKTQKKK